MQGIIAATKSSLMIENDLSIQFSDSGSFDGIFDHIFDCQDHQSATIRESKKKFKKMVDRAIKVVILEGDFAAICDLGFPIALCLQLQTNALKLSEAMWTAKSSGSGFSVSLFWPTSKVSNVKSQKKRRRRRKHKATTTVDVATSTSSPAQPVNLNAKSVSPSPNSAHLINTDQFQAYGP